MAIVQTLDQYAFSRAFEELRPDNFSYEGRKALFEYFEEVSDNMGTPFELDVIAICCDWSESDWETIAQDYRIDLSDFDDEDDKIEAVREYLNDNTQVIELSDGETFIYQDF